MATIASLDVSLGANSTRLNKGLKTARKRTKRFSKGASADLKKVGVALLAAFSLRAIGGTLDRLDVLAKTIASIGADTREFQILTQTFSEFGIEAGVVSNSILKLEQNLGSAAQGLSAQVKALEGLGLAYEDVFGLTAIQKFDLVIDRLRGVNDANLRARIGADLLGRGYLKLTRVVNGTAGEFSRVRKERDKLGAVLSAKQLKNVEKFNDQLSRTGDLGTTIGFGILDELFGGEAGEGLKKFNEYLGDNKDEIAKFAVDISRLASAILVLNVSLNFIKNLGIFFTGLGIVGGNISIFGKTLTALFEQQKAASNFIKGSLGSNPKQIDFINDAAKEVNRTNKALAALRSLSPGVVDFLSKISNRIKGSLTKAVFGLLGALLQLFSILSIIYKVITEGTKAVSDWEIGFLALGSALTIIAIPFLGTIGLIIALGTVLDKYSDNIRAFVTGTGDSIQVTDYARRALIKYKDEIDALTEANDKANEATRKLGDRIANDITKPLGGATVETLEQSVLKFFDSQSDAIKKIARQEVVRATAIVDQIEYQKIYQKLLDANAKRFPQGFDPSQGGPNPFILSDLNSGAATFDIRVDVGGGKTAAQAIAEYFKGVELQAFEAGKSIGGGIADGISNGIVGSLGPIQESILALGQNSEGVAITTANSNREIAQATVNATGEVFKALATQSEKAFRVHKAFQIAAAVIDAYRAFNSALTAPPPLGFILAAAALAQGLATISKIKAQQFNPPRRFGGRVTGGLPGLVGENGPELFVPDTSGTIIPNSKDGGNYGNSFGNVNIQVGPGASPADIADTFSDDFASKANNFALDNGNDETFNSSVQFV